MQKISPGPTRAGALAELHVRHWTSSDSAGTISQICHLQANTEPVIKTGLIKAA